VPRSAQLHDKKRQMTNILVENENSHIYIVSLFLLTFVCVLGLSKGQTGSSRQNENNGEFHGVQNWIGASDLGGAVFISILTSFREIMLLLE